MSYSTTAQTPDADLGIEPFEGEPTDDAEILPLQNGGFPVVGIGGSAGAIPALQEFFRQMPDNPDSTADFDPTKIEIDSQLKVLTASE